MAKNKRVPTLKTRNAGTLTESAFWSFIRSALRQKSRFWKPITQCKMKSRRAYKGPLKRQKFEYQCKECLNWFPDKKINVDHKIPVGALNCSADLARKVLNYETKTDLRDGLVELVEWIKEQGIKPFSYHLPLEIVSEKTPKSWKDQLM